VNQPQRILIAGCGELGVRVGGLLPGALVYGLRRRTAALPAGIHPIAADLCTGDGFDALPRGIDTLVYCPTPDARVEAAYRTTYVDGLARLLEALPSPAPTLRVLFVSSSAVYGQNAGEWVDETSPTEAPGFNGRILLEAEALARARAPSCALRLAGLYGPGRLWLLRRLRAGQPIAAGCHWTNRIHLDDAAALIVTVLRQPLPPPVVIGVDDEPSAEGTVLDGLADRMGLPRLPREGDPSTISGKRLRNHLARTLGWRPRYASWRDGYADVLTSFALPTSAP
jgi:nucleoside-diphosphate-sugar epimerase